MVQLQEVFDPNKEEKTVLIRQRKSDSPTGTDSWIDKCHAELDELYDTRNLVSVFISEMNKQSETFSAIDFANAWLQIASSKPELYSETISAIKALALSSIKDIDDAIHFSIQKNAHNYAADEYGKPEVVDGDDFDGIDEEAHAVNPEEDDTERHDN